MNEKVAGQESKGDAKIRKHPHTARRSRNQAQERYTPRKAKETWRKRERKTREAKRVAGNSENKGKWGSTQAEKKG